MEDEGYQYLILIFVIFVLAFLFLNRRYSISKLYNNSIPAPWTLNHFLKSQNRQNIDSDNLYLFSEQLVRSYRFKITGRFDQAILHTDDRPVLDAIIEKKFPVHILPRVVHKEDMFQAGLYALAIMDQEVSIDSAKLVVIYCIQEKALKCVQKTKAIACLECKYSRVFVKRFAPSKIIKQLKKLDEIWYGQRKPKASPSIKKCRICPYGESICKHSKA
jgi:hypothetical protein